ncbi:MAG TPA: symmetrical bis(5'-nucleosyl)-tetraphosphatase [Burkholderiales bacterium]
MATFAIGDVQGCFDELRKLLEIISFHKKKDRLWFVGDLVNRGPKSLEVLRFVRDLGARAITVLGNHDLHLVTQYEGFERPRKDDTFQDVLEAPDARDLVDWLRARPLMHGGEGCAMVHAGLLPQWTIDKALALAAEVEAALQAADYRNFLQNMYGSKPAEWREDLEGWDRLRVIVNAMTRMRFCTARGKMEFHAKGEKPPRGFRRWFDTYRGKKTVIFGHWSQLGLTTGERHVGLDSGCVWGGQLTALRLEDRALYQLACRRYQAPGGDG